MSLTVNEIKKQMAGYAIRFLKEGNSVSRARNLAYQEMKKFVPDLQRKSEQWVNHEPEFVKELNQYMMRIGRTIQYRVTNFGTLTPMNEKEKREYWKNINAGRKFGY